MDRRVSRPWKVSASIEAMEPRLLLAVTPLMTDKSWATINGYADAGGKFYYLTNNAAETKTALWVSNGTLAGTLKLGEWNHAAPADSVEEIWTINSTVVFTVDDGSHGVELWKSNGTVAGTTLLKDINPGAVGSDCSGSYWTLGTYSYFWANDGAHGMELWKTDGTTANTVMVKDIRPGMLGSASIYGGGIVQVGMTLYFGANDGSHGTELWRSDGTTAGTLLVKDIVAGTGSSNPTALTAYNGSLLFTAGTGLYISNGTAAGTTLLKTFSASLNTSLVVLSNNVVLFNATETATGSELWKTNGTAAGTVIVKDIIAGPTGSGATPRWMGGTNWAYVTLDTMSSMMSGMMGELWRSDGTSVGTTLVYDFSPDEAYAMVLPIWTDGTGTAYISAGFFAEVDGDPTITQLWKSNGTTAGTSMIKQFNTDPEMPGIYYYIPGAGTIGYFIVDENTTGSEVWQTNGTTVGTVIVQNLNAGAADGAQQLIWSRAVAQQLFWGNDGTGWRLYAVGGSTTPLTITGTTGNDTITITQSGDTLSYTRNSVTTTRSAAATSSITIDASAGADTVTVNSSVMIGVTISGGDGNDTINGGSGADYIQGGNGNDVLNGNAGNDTIYGQFDNDSMTGGLGSDYLAAGLGNDTVDGGDACDSLFAGDGTDRVLGGAGDDYIEGRGKADSINGGDGHDTIIGGAGNDSIYGEAGDDWLYSGISTVFVDRLDGGVGIDRYEGDANDELVACEVNLLA